MDFIGGLPKVQGINNVMVVVDMLTKYSHFSLLVIHIQQRVLLKYSTKK